MGKDSYLKVKRALDFSLALLGLIILAPLFLILALMIKLDSKGPVFFTQKRVGIHKKYFNILKFRTMRTDTPKNMPTHMLKDPEQYITKTGRILRRTSLDELPQIINILRGDMSIVGPRPALWNQYDLISEREKYGANDVLPGLTGWAQIHGRDELEIPVKAKLDGYYVRHMSLGMDIRCFFATIFKVLREDGVVEGGTGTVHQNYKVTDGTKAAKRKKILIITNHSYMLYRFRRELIEALMENHEVVLSMPFVGHEDDFMAMGLRCIKTDVDRRGINPKTDYRLFKTYCQMMKKEKPDLVLTYSIKPNIYAGLACGIQNIRFCANVQGLGTAFQKPGLAQFVTVLYKAAFRKVDTVFFENEGNAKLFIKHKIIPAKKVKLLHGAGINLKEYPYKPYPKCNSEHEKIHFLYLGRIMKEKGIDELFDAAKRLHREGHAFVLDLVGFFEDAYKEKVEELQRMGIAEFHGFQEEPRPYYEAADCVVMPSYHEGMSNVLLEAAAMGRPVITTNIYGCREAVEHGKTGILCKVKNTDSLYEAMKKFLGLSEKKRENMGVLGRQKMEKEFAKEKVVEETVRVLVRQ